MTKRTNCQKYVSSPISDSTCQRKFEKKIVKDFQTNCLKNFHRNYQAIFHRLCKRNYWWTSQWKVQRTKKFWQNCQRNFQLNLRGTYLRVNAVQIPKENFEARSNWITNESSSHTVIHTKILSNKKTCMEIIENYPGNTTFCVFTPLLKFK